MESVPNNEWFKIYIDYAHTADALEKVLQVLEEHKWDGRIITVFWATWDRDKSKRPIMWRVVADKSDIVFLTQDDDYSEITENIMKDVMPGIERKEWENFWIIADRGEAIRTALLTAKEGDTLLLAWKGDEHVMITNNGAIEWHDRTFAESILKDIDDNKIMS
jgi:UDP-N-acetylmuramoyl-L-alanyl-D-glutamate--2,6-diaminopimelate ligase